MFDKYAKIVKEDPLAGTLSIQEFLGSCPTDATETIFPPSCLDENT